MVLVIVQKKNGALEVQKINRITWMAMNTARGWYENGNWSAIKEYVYRRNLHKTRRQPRDKKKIIVF